MPPMPEGDTLFRTATVLRRVLVGGVLTSALARPGPMVARVPDLSGLVGLAVTSVEARGKHLLITVGEGRHRRILRTHLRMTGSWHWYRVGERWRQPESRATVVLRTASVVAACFACPTVELLTSTGLERSPALRHLGPDLLAPSPDLATAVANLRGHPLRAVGEALLDQSLVAGIGNVVRNEALFMERLSPFAPVGSLDGGTLERLLKRARHILATNVGGGGRVTTGDRRRGAALWVYGRPGRPCRRCGTTIRFARQGPIARHTYWCPSCQP
jgi:endonuclease-8